MKKVYLGLFALAMSLSAFGVYATTAPVSLFSDSFESGNFSNWTTADKGSGKWAILPGVLIKAQDGKRDAEVSRILKKPSTDWKLTKNTSTTGYDNITLSFYYLIPKLGHLEANDHFVAEYFDGATWQKVGDITNTDTGKSWQLANYNLPTGANNNEGFAFRLRAQFSPAVKGLDALDTVIIDNVKLTGSAVTPVLVTHDISVSLSEYGNISYSSTTVAEQIDPMTILIKVNSGGNQTFLIIPNTGYEIKNLVVDGAVVSATSTYTFSGVTANHTFGAVFAPTIPTGVSALSPSAFHQWAPSVYGDIVTWADYRSGKWEVYYRDLTKGEDTKITDLNSSIYLNPVVDHRNIVYSTEFSQAYIYNIDTKQTVKVSDSLAQQCPEISGNYVVWMDGRNSQEPGMQNKSDIYLKDLSTGEERSLSGPVLMADNHGCPRIQGDKVVWADNSSSRDLNNYDIFLDDLSTNQKTQITNISKNQQDPDIYGDIIVWGDYRNSTTDQWYNSDIYMYDIAAKKETQLTNNNAEIGTTAENSQLFQGYPAIYGNNIIYGDNTNDPVSGDVSKMNLATKEITRVVNDSNITQSQADIYENTVVWMDYRSGVPNIYISR